jgi:hypothetical protein
LCLLCRHSITWAMPQALFASDIFLNRVLQNMPGMAWIVMLLFMLPLYLGWKAHTIMPIFYYLRWCLVNLLPMMSLNSSPFSSTSLVARITDMSHHTKINVYMLKHENYITELLKVTYLWDASMGISDAVLPHEVLGRMSAKAHVLWRLDHGWRIYFQGNSHTSLLLRSIIFLTGFWFTSFCIGG